MLNKCLLSTNAHRSLLNIHCQYQKSRVTAVTENDSDIHYLLCTYYVLKHMCHVLYVMYGRVLDVLIELF